ncbi:TrkA-C domain-containing protein [Halopseudomonas xinjiangensis]|uniref:TrkA-C domain-containing protein n=1 Tax=Halopseudomonas xinjiangensis TaxID=487184 RepID=A0A1H1L4Q9_9GAMM|nr:SLC13 family permease [Halopseudomonas xinjiangensis]SDR69526.1 TrkA-C domain-containing protein [Halopseudomonas xinjiangensis]
MTSQQITIFIILAATIGLFLWGRWRHDVVALAALLACVITGLTPTEQAFDGFSNPAVITVAAVLVLSKGLQSTGAVEAMAQRILPQRGSLLPSLAMLVGLGALLSAFMNNVGAMALLMPIAMQLANRQNLPPGKVLMPLAFGTILGGMTTLIGTPPNLIVSNFRRGATEVPFDMFDFLPVGGGIALVGILMCVFLGRWLVPSRARSDGGSFDTGTYLTEVHIGEGTKAVGRTLGDIEKRLDEFDAQIVGLVRNDFRVTAPYPGRHLQAGDILVIEADPEGLGATLTRLGLKLEEAVPTEPVEGDSVEADASETDESPRTDADDPARHATSSQARSPAETVVPSADEGAEREEKEPEERKNAHQDIVIQELVVQPGSPVIGRSASDLQIRTRFSINLLAISRTGHRSIRRLRWTDLQAGDVLLMQGRPEAISGFANEYNCVPLAQRSILIPDTRKASLALVIMVAAILLAAFDFLPVALAFTAGVLLFMLTKAIPLRQVYESIDWPIVVLLGAMFPLAGAMADTGAADLLARTLLAQIGDLHPAITIGVVMLVTMTLSDFMNNAATAAVMCPIALGIASQMGVNPDSLLMAVAIGASCAFLTPIGHQNNTLILGPGGFSFGDYWRLGLPMELMVLLLGVPLLMWVWPL